MKHDHQVKIFGFSNYHFTQNSNLRTMEFHQHNSIEISYVLDGELLIDYFDANGKLQTFFLRPNQLAITKPFVKHRTSVSIGLRSMGLELVAENDVVGGIVRSLAEECPDIQPFFGSFNDIIVLRDTINVQNTLKQFNNYVNENKQYTALLAELEMKKLFVQILSCSQNHKIAKQFNRHINNAILFIKQNFNKDIQSEQVAKNLGLSNVYFQKLFHQETGTKFTRYVNEQRIAYATTLLTTTNYSLGKISAMVGYNNTQNFINNFKAIQNTTPKKFREHTFDGYHAAPQSPMSSLYQETVFKND